MGRRWTASRANGVISLQCFVIQVSAFACFAVMQRSHISGHASSFESGGIFGVFLSGACSDTCKGSFFVTT